MEGSRRQASMCWSTRMRTTGNRFSTKYPDRVFITPHMGWYSEEAIQDLQRKTALNVLEMLTKGAPLYRV